ncbi:phospholipid-binding protein [Heterostelium album PN500]|uniref:Phospholipid-binding protein n=1 Tax=Heterostelium pallidum (strain ATCC 26659 / Pp 5 / PN500) TaxID=670386 RepID=D3B2C9_HETP5|nr:phospholipid-binding protein [Heterostelium album PN500]EFA84504.1 phospholipid-binding protein [Heterostelium album PN500]|eukprot:XP_020436618.1 phospholipid-binding protein [Heterostelium album PN500]
MKFLLSVILFLAIAASVNGHGYTVYPPARQQICVSNNQNSIWWPSDGSGIVDSWCRNAWNAVYNKYNQNPSAAQTQFVQINEYAVLIPNYAQGLPALKAAVPSNICGAGASNANAQFGDKSGFSIVNNWPSTKINAPVGANSVNITFTWCATAVHNPNSVAGQYPGCSGSALFKTALTLPARYSQATIVARYQRIDPAGECFINCSDYYSSSCNIMNNPTSKVELRFQCTGLTNKDTFSKSDPQVFVFSQIGDLPPVRVGNTEKINNNLNPQFKTPVYIDYFFEISQKLTLSVYDIDSGTFDKDNDFIGTANVGLASIISSPGSTFKSPLKSKHGHHAGYIIVSAEIIRTSKQRLSFQMSGDHFDKKDLFGKSDPYYTISKNSANGFVQAFKSEVHMNTLNPVFKSVDLSLDDLTGGDMKRELLFSFYDYDSIGKHDFIGSFCTNAEALVSTPNKFALINQKKKEKKSSYSNSGTVDITRALITREPSFVDYLVGGCEISLVVGIDCTASNLTPTDKNSLHYHHPTIPNAYANAIVSIGNVLTPYDYDGMVPVYGFGATIPPNDYKTDDCFAMSLDPNNVYVRGVEGILDVYYRNITKVDFSGPTCFAPIINNTARMASESNQYNQKYTILLMITDGEIMDMEATVQAIINASSKALSIVIVGVGNANFDSMVQLDGDDGLLSNSTSRASRDIVQFVAHRDFKNKPFHMLAEETLKEIPRQFMDYMLGHGIKPNPPRQYVPQQMPVVVPEVVAVVQPVPVVTPVVANESAITSLPPPPPPTDLVQAVSTLEIDEQPQPAETDDNVQQQQINPSDNSNNNNNNNPIVSLEKAGIVTSIDNPVVSLDKPGIVTTPENPVISLDKDGVVAVEIPPPSDCVEQDNSTTTTTVSVSVSSSS